MAAAVAFYRRLGLDPDAGHNVGTFPYAAAGTSQVHPVTGTPILLGGTRPGAAAAQAQSWPEVLACWPAKPR